MDVDGLFARLFEDLHIPYVTWFVDDPRTMLMGRTCYATDYSVALTWDQAYVAYLRNCRFPEVHVVPLAVDATVFNAEPADHWPIPPTFVGNSMADFSQREQGWLDQHPGLRDAVASAFAEGRVTRENFGTGIEAILDPETAAKLDAEAARHAEMVFFIEGTRRLRHKLAETLTPFGLELRGDPAWQRSFPAAKGPLNYLEELPGFYRSCAVNLNVTSIQMPHTVNQRVFDCPAAGGFLLTDAQPDLDELFDVETEVVRYRSFGECTSLLQEYLARPEARRSVTLRARARILGEHTYAHRLEQIGSILPRPIPRLRMTPRPAASQTRVVQAIRHQTP